MGRRLCPCGEYPGGGRIDLHGPQPGGLGKLACSCVVSGLLRPSAAASTACLSCISAVTIASVWAGAAAGADTASSSLMSALELSERSSATVARASDVCCGFVNGNPSLLSAPPIPLARSVCCLRSSAQRLLRRLNRTVEQRLLLSAQLDRRATRPTAPAASPVAARR